MSEDTISITIVRLLYGVYSMLMSPMWYIAIGGALGGFIAGLNNPAANALKLPRLKTSTGKWFPAWESLEIGFVGDCLTGSAAGVAILLFAVSFGVSLAEGTDPSSIAKILSLGVVAGFAGRKLLDNLADMVTRRVDAVEKRQQSSESELRATQQIAELLREAKYNLAIKNYEQALTLFKKVVERDPGSKFGRNGIAACLIYRGSDKVRCPDTGYDVHALQESIDILDSVVRDYPDFEPAIYNRAWAKHEFRKATLKKPGGPRYSISDIVDDLERAFKIEPSGTSYIETDEVFKDVKDDPKVAELISKARSWLESNRHL